MIGILIAVVGCTDRIWIFNNSHVYRPFPMGCAQFWALVADYRKPRSPQRHGRNSCRKHGSSDSKALVIATAKFSTCYERNKKLWHRELLMHTIIGTRKNILHIYVPGKKSICRACARMTAGITRGDVAPLWARSSSGFSICRPCPDPAEPDKSLRCQNRSACYEQHRHIQLILQQLNGKRFDEYE